MPSSSSLSISLLPLLREYKAILDTTAAFQDIGVFGVIVAFADDVGRAKFELFGKRGGACPLYRVFVVVGTAVLAAHHIGFIEAACRTANAFQLERVSRLH